MKELVSASGQDAAEALVDRDQYDHPLILPRSGHKTPCKPRPKGGCHCMVPYIRSSTIGETLSDSFGLNRWQKGNMLKGIGKRPDIVNMARVVRSPSELYELVDLAEALGDNDVAARNGSLMHRLTEDLDNGRELPDGLPDNIQAMLAAYRAEVIDRCGLVTLDTERFTVQDPVKIAGTYDKRCKKTSGEQRGCGIYLADVKTGQILDRIALKTCMQVCTYVGSYYDVGTGERTRVNADRDWGLLIWLPWVEKAEDAQCEVRWLDLRQGRIAVREALKVRDMRKLKASQLMPRVK